MQQQDSSSFSSLSAVSFCPSFNCYSSDELADIAAKVGRELKLEESNSKEEEQRDERNHGDDDDDFEFFSRFDAQIHQVYPVFNRDLLKGVDYCNYHHNRGDEQSRYVAEPAGWPLKKMFVADDDDHHQGRPPSSSSSSDADEPEKEEVADLAFCVWSPIESSPSRCKKSNSTGSSATSSSSSSSKKWLKFRDLLKRSNSDGKDAFVFLSKPKKEKKGSKEVKSSKTTAAVSAHEAFYVKNRAIKQGDKKRSYLPYRQDLLGFFTNHKGVGKTLPPF